MFIGIGRVSHGRFLWDAAMDGGMRTLGKIMALRGGECI